MSTLREAKAEISSSTRSQSRDIHDDLHLDIVRGRLLPGSKLRLDDLKTRYRVSLSPLREALMKLSSEGLVILEDHKGFKVAPISRNDLLDITSTRQDIESIALQKSILNGRQEWEAEIVSSLHALKNIQKIGADGMVDDHWEKCHSHFHNSLVAACNSGWLQKFRLQLHHQAERYRRLSVHYARSPRADLEEHIELADFTLARDIEGSCYLIRRHFKRTCQILLESDIFP